jgi:hypothetical protein
MYLEQKWSHYGEWIELVAHINGDPVVDDKRDGASVYRHGLSIKTLRYEI